MHTSSLLIQQLVKYKKAQNPHYVNKCYTLLKRWPYHYKPRLQRTINILTIVAYEKTVHVARVATLGVTLKCIHVSGLQSKLRLPVTAIRALLLFKAALY